MIKFTFGILCGMFLFLGITAAAAVGVALGVENKPEDVETPLDRRPLP